MTRIEKDAKAFDERLFDSWTSEGEVPPVIRSHRAPRAPRSRFARTAPVTLALALLAGLLSAVGIAQRDTPGPSWFEPQPETAIAMAELPDTILDDPAPERQEATQRASRSQRKAAPQAKHSVQPRSSRWVAPLLGKLRPTSCFGVDRGDHTHGGLDLDGETGDTVRSVGAGTVVQAGYRYSGSGLSVVVRHGTELTMYAHLSATSVRQGVQVKPGQKVGELGSTGNSTGSHLHFAVSKTSSLGKLWDRLINPVPWLETHGVAVPGHC